jgi:hypothetical protein
MEGSLHGFLVLQTLDGKTIAEGDLIETAKAATVKVQMVFHFHDGSYYEETSEFSQRGQFRLLRNHLVQKGPSFKMAMERSIDASTGQVSVRYTDDKGNQKEESEHIELPADLANGMFLVLIKNIDPAKAETTVSAVAGEPKPRVVKVVITPEGKAPFLVGRSKREAIEFNLKPHIEGAAGVIAPLVGKQPARTGRPRLANRERGRGLALRRSSDGKQETIATSATPSNCPRPLRAGACSIHFLS